MNGDPLWLVSLLLSTFLSFFTAACLVEFALWLFRIKNHRLRASLRLFPLLSLGIDVLFSKVSTGNFLNPLHCESCVQKLLLSFAPELKKALAEQQISWSKHLAAQLPEQLFPLGAALFGIATLFFVFRKTLQIALFHRALKKIKKTPIQPIQNPLLAQALQKTAVFESSEIQIPLATGFKTILLPMNQEQREAVIAHELEHLRWKDPLVKCVSEAISALFWWIPMRWWLNRLEQEQELAADASISKYQIEKTSLAEALLSAAKRKPLLATSFAGSPLLLRLHVLLDPSFSQRTLMKRALAGLCIGALAILSCLMM